MQNENTPTEGLNSAKLEAAETDQTKEIPAVDLTRLVVHLRSVLEYAERETCTHEETHRGGAMWEICDRCGMKWADDEGGKPADAHDLPQILTDARDFLHSLHNA